MSTTLYPLNDVDRNSVLNLNSRELKQGRDLVNSEAWRKRRVFDVQSKMREEWRVRYGCRITHCREDGLKHQMR